MRETHAQAAIGVALIVLSIAWMWSTLGLPSDAGYAGIGPKFFPGCIAVALFVTGAMLVGQAFTGGYREPGEVPEVRADWRAFMWITIGVVLACASVGFLGFTIASALLFTCVAHAFGDRGWVRGLVYGVVLGAITMLVFRGVLSVQLPILPVLLGT